MTRVEARELVGMLTDAVLEASDGFVSDKKCNRRDRLVLDVIAALCTDPNAELLEACKRLYDIVFCLTVREVIELGDDAIAAIDLNPTVSMRIWQDSTERINLDWASAAIAAAEEE